MAATEHKERREICAPLCSLRSLAALVCVVLCPLVSKGEDVLVLRDGTRYTNVVFVTNKAGWVDIKHDGGQSGIKTEKLPEEFRIKHGLEGQNDSTNSSNKPSSADLFLARYRNFDPVGINSWDSDWVVKKKIEDRSDGKEKLSWEIELNPKEFRLTSYKYTSHLDGNDPKTYSIPGTLDAAYLNFSLIEEATARFIFGKYLEWESIASTNKAESFQKLITKYRDPTSSEDFFVRTFTFAWDKENDAASLTHLDWYPTRTYLTKADVVNFCKLMDLLPSLKEELAQKIREREAKAIEESHNREAQKNLFK